MTYHDLADLAKTRKRKLAHNTYLRPPVEGDTSIGIRFHDTEILTFSGSGRIVLNTGGWRTVTTKARFNAFLPAPWRIHQTNSTWYLSHGSPSEPQTYREWVYADGCSIAPTQWAEVSDALPRTATATNLKTARAINRYAAGR